MPPEQEHFALNRSLALVLWAKGAADEDDVAVFPGRLVARDGQHFLGRDEPEPDVRLLDEWMDRIVLVPIELRAILQGCEYQLALTVGDAPEDSADWEKLGIKWPS